MQKSTAQALFDIYEKMLQTLAEAEPYFTELPTTDEREKIQEAHANLIGQILVKLRLPLIREYPELVADVEMPITPDNIIPQDRLEFVANLTNEQIATIDNELLLSCSHEGQKVAKVIATTMIKIGENFPNIPDSFYSQRIAYLVQQGKLESRGNLNFMRFSEVRLV